MLLVCRHDRDFLGGIQKIVAVKAVAEFEFGPLMMVWD